MTSYIEAALPKENETYHALDGPKMFEEPLSFKLYILRQL